MPANVWAIDGLLTPASVARLGNFQAMKGMTGICLPTDLQVRALDVPGGAVQIMPGGASIVNTFAAASKGQAYMTQLEEAEQLAIAATGSGAGATRRVWQRINDSQYAGSTKDATFGYGSSWPTTFPYVKLATIVQPASTATITQAMITDERVVANPLSTEVRASRPNVTSDAGKTLTSRAAYPVGEWFPNVGGGDNTGRYDIDVPWWATRMQIRCEWLSIRYSNNPGAGYYWVAYGPNAGGTPTYYTQGFGWDADAATSTTNWVLEQDVPVLPAWRGTTLAFVPRANKTTDTSFPGTVGLTARSGMLLSVRFLQVAESI